MTGFEDALEQWHLICAACGSEVTTRKELRTTPITTLRSAVYAYELQVLEETYTCYSAPGSDHARYDVVLTQVPQASTKLMWDPIEPSCDHSWFPGYAWQVVRCSGCTQRPLPILGWQFWPTGTVGTTSGFFALIVTRLRERFGSSTTSDPERFTTEEERIRALLNNGPALIALLDAMQAVAAFPYGRGHQVQMLRQEDPQSTSAEVLPRRREGLAARRTSDRPSGAARRGRAEPRGVLPAILQAVLPAVSSARVAVRASDAGPASARAVAARSSGPHVPPSLGGRSSTSAVMAPQTVGDAAESESSGSESGEQRAFEELRRRTRASAALNVSHQAAPSPPSAPKRRTVPPTRMLPLGVGSPRLTRHALRDLAQVGRGQRGSPRSARPGK
eukprot:TRINITY_DN38000_c0_g1_i1.p1 TRINITY_DN38000_c0_g1~~TRINITY_DN38000_c0_g1_i1.p1  ORF type:complete len:390 (+),score=18.13 TRINITY_DN38000_c0_g1_i1:114-1283(+)